MHVQTDIYIYIYTNIAESRIERDYWPRYAHAAINLLVGGGPLSVIISCVPSVEAIECGSIDMVCYGMMT